MPPPYPSHNAKIVPHQRKRSDAAKTSAAGRDDELRAGGVFQLFVDLVEEHDFLSPTPPVRDLDRGVRRLCGFLVTVETSAQNFGFKRESRFLKSMAKGSQIGQMLGELERSQLGRNFAIIRELALPKLRRLNSQALSISGK